VIFTIFIFQEHVTNSSASFINGVFKCKFTRDASVTKAVSSNTPMTFDLEARDYHVLFAGGNIASERQLFNFLKQRSSSSSIMVASLINHRHSPRLLMFASFVPTFGFTDFNLTLNT